MPGFIEFFGGVDTRPCRTAGFGRGQLMLFRFLPCQLPSPGFDKPVGRRGVLALYTVHAPVLERVNDDGVGCDELVSGEVAGGSSRHVPPGICRTSPAAPASRATG